MELKYSKIGDLCNVSSSRRVFAKQYVEEGIPFYRQKEIIDKKNNTVLEDPIFISESAYNELKEKSGVPVSGDLLLTAVGATLGIPYVVKDEKFYFKDGNLIWLSNFKNELNSEFLYYWIDSSFGTQTLWNRTIGSAQPALTIDSIKKLSIPIPDRAIQDKIVSALKTYEALIENNIKRIKLLERMTENLYKEWFVDFRFPGHENITLKKLSPRGWVTSSNSTNMACPENWSYGPLSQFGSFVRGKNITAAEMIEGNIPVISAGIEPSGYHNENNVTGQSITVSASGANAGYLKYHLSDIWAADCSYFQDDEKIWFVYNALKFLQPVISNLQTGAAQPHVYPKHINSLCTIIPDDDTIKAYCDKVKPIYEQIKLLKTKNENLVKQRAMLLPRLMSGKLEV